MGRLVRDATLDTRTARGRLKVRPKPYYRSLDPGLHLGYRRSANGGSWLARIYLGQQAYRLERVATADDKADADGVAVLSFSQAQAAARSLFVSSTRRAAGLPEAGPYTVGSALNEYISWLEQERRTARDARWAADAFILPTLGHIRCDRLTSAQIQKWLYDLAKAPPRLRSKKGTKAHHQKMDTTDVEVRRRRQSSSNRVLTTLKAALNRAWRHDRITSDKAWRSVKPFVNVDASRARYLTPEECKRLVNASSGAFRDLVLAGLFTGCRYSELTRVVVSDVNPDSATLAIRMSKTGTPRHVVLSEEGARFFGRLAMGKSANGLLLVRDDGAVWEKSWQVRPMRAACKAARIKPAVSFHVLRHTWASLTVMNGAPLLVVAKNLGHSSTRMVEKHYGHLAPSFIADAIRDAAPRFGLPSERTVTALRVRHPSRPGRR
jgi:integrase